MTIIKMWDWLQIGLQCTLNKWDSNQIPIRHSLNGTLYNWNICWMGWKMLQEPFFPFSPLRIPFNVSILYMYISTNTTNIGIDQLISSHRPRKLRKSKVYLKPTKSIIKTLTLIVRCAVKCLIERRLCFSRGRKNG